MNEGGTPWKQFAEGNEIEAARPTWHSRWNELFETPKYQALGQIWARDSAAIKRLFTRLKASWDADKWGGDRNVVFIDDSGIEQKCRCQSVELDRLQDRKEVILFEQLGPRRVLDSVLHSKNSKDELEPRFDFEGEDFRGLALMAELSTDFERAGEWWAKYKASVAADSPEAADAAHHLAQLPAEKTAGEVWAYVQSNRRNASATMDQFDPSKRSVSDDEWREFLDEQRKLNERIGAIQEGLDRLATNAAIARSVWGASLRELPHPAAAYAGDEIEKAIHDRLIQKAWKQAFKGEAFPR